MQSDSVLCMFADILLKVYGQSNCIMPSMLIGRDCYWVGPCIYV